MHRKTRDRALSLDRRPSRSIKRHIARRSILNC
jgi:hypothetical protein